MINQFQMVNHDPYLVISLQKNDAFNSYWTGVVSTSYKTGPYCFYNIRGIVPLVSDCLQLGLTQDQIDEMQKLEEEEFLDSLKEACKKVNTEFWYQFQENERVKEIKVCNLCKHYSLLNGFCHLLGVPKKPKDNCEKWEE